MSYCSFHKIPQLKNQRGISALTLSLTLPILLVLILSSLELFLYFRAASVVQRAASEASQALASASPGGKNYSPHSLPKVKNKILIKTPSGGNTEKNVLASFASHGQLYERSDGSFEDSIKLPFLLSSSENGDLTEEDSNGKIKHSTGVHYLPFVTAVTCLEPVNETSHLREECGSTNNSTSTSNGFLTYQLPSRIDFDGDGHEDLAFFYPNALNDDWWIIPSSSGTLFRSSLRYNLVESSDTHLSWLPCPADYDGDKKTDLCVAAVDAELIRLRIRFSSKNYYHHKDFLLNDIRAQSILPMPGRFDAQLGKDQFAAVLVNTHSSEDNLSTYIWPGLTEMSNSALETSFSLTDVPLINSDYTNKPTAGRNWRPAFGDHDGNGSIDIGWLTWEGGYPVSLLAETQENTKHVDTKTSARKTQISPWGLFYPKDLQAAGLYIVDRTHHRVGLITAGADGIVQGQFDSNTTAREQFKIIAGTPSLTVKTELASPDPMNRGLFDSSPVPTTSRDNGCKTCLSGGSYSGDGSRAFRATLNSPRDVFTLGSGPLFIADFGNYRIRKVDPGRDNIVNGGHDETISTIAGGIVAPGVICPSTRISNGISQPWSNYSPENRLNGIHPTCVSIRPLSLTMDISGPTLFVGDEGGVVFAISPGADREFNSSPDETIKVIVGNYRSYSTTKPRKGISPTKLKIGFPTALDYVSSDTSDTSASSGLYILSRASGIPLLNNTRAPNGGGLFVVKKGSDRKFGTNDDKVSVVAGTWVAHNRQTVSTYGDPLSSPAGDLKNPTDFVFVSTADSRTKKHGLFPTEHAFITGWWNDPTNNSFENSILHYSSGSSSEANIRWLNNSHLNSWGKQAPYLSSNKFSKLKWTPPLTTVPVEPSSGVAISPDYKYLYFSQTRLGQVLIVKLDQDGDGLQDFSNSNSPTNDKDTDGDGIPNESDKFPFVPQAQNSKQLRLMNILQDPLMWAKAARGKIDAAGVKVDRIEWWLDRFAETTTVPYSSTQPIPPGEVPPFVLLTNNTIAAPNPRGIMHSQPVWPRGITRDNEIGSKLGSKQSHYQLAPIILASKSPNELQIKDVSGYDQCSDWTLDVGSDKTTLLPNGSPVSDCSRNISKPLYDDGRTVGIRRAHLSHWKNQWPNFSDPLSTKNELVFIDWDGNGARNPTIFDTESVSKGVPLMAHIGNLSTNAPSHSSPNNCPGAFAIKELSLLETIITERLRKSGTAIGPSNLTQYKCANDKKFFTSSTAPYVSIMTDTHAEWETTATRSSVTYEQIKSDRLSVGVKGDSDTPRNIGAVAETAYRVLESSLRVKRRESNTNPHEALVRIYKESSKKELDSVVVEVSYTFPLNPILARIYGSNMLLIRQSSRRRAYNFGRN